MIITEKESDCKCFFRTDLALELKEGGQSELLDVPCKNQRERPL